ncbi:MAG TPA: S16 family serine protease [Candidatus Nitrosotalea sp.]|nr:S16 family serine protease [Candidatus Nitrosotalea sp.]
MILIGTFVILYSLQASAQESPIPSWVKNTARWWSQNQTTDSDFLQTMQYLIDNNILHVPGSNQYTQSNSIVDNMSDVSNNQLTAKLDDLQIKYNSLQTKYNLLVQQVTSLGDHSSNTEDNNATISAVAVSPVIQSDGFFETTSYQGAVLKITVDVRDGTGLVLVNTAIPTGVDFQTSAKTAVTVAHNVTGTDLSKKDVIFSISTGNNQNLQAVDGGSAGGAMTVLLISDILGKSINNQVLMTGTIQSDGTIGPIGAAAEKADAAGQFGAKIFLVPQGQGVMSVQTCSQSNEGPVTYQTCTTQEKPLSPTMESKYGMKVIEINTIQDALKYFNSS